MKSTPSKAEAIIKINHNISFYSTGGASSCFLHRSEVMEYLKQQNLVEYLQIPATTSNSTSMTVSCPFHTDETPSASIFQDQTSGHWLLTCHSDHCDFNTGSIIEIACRQLGNVDTDTALEHLMCHYHIQLDRQKWIDENVSCLQENIEFIRNLNQYRDQYPHLYSVLCRVREDIISKLRVAIELIHNEPISVNNRHVFFFSLRRFEQRKKGSSCLPQYHNKQSKKIDRYCLLGLMHKLADDQIPRNLLVRAYEQQNAQNHQNRVQFYSFPHYTAEVLREAERVAKVLKEQKVRMRGMSRGLIQDVFGAEVADRVYPQCRNKPCYESNTGLAYKVLDAIWEDITHDGYTTLQKIFEHVHQSDQFISVTLERISRLLPGMLSRSKLKEVSATKVLKEKYKIDSRGYPRIIIRESELVESNPLSFPRTDRGLDQAV